MPLAAGVVEGLAAVPTLRALENSVRTQGHVDTGLTGTYFMYGAEAVMSVRRVHQSDAPHSGPNCLRSCRYGVTELLF